MILTIDTAAGRCAARLTAHGQSHEAGEEVSRGHDRLLAPMVTGLLQQAGQNGDALERVIICTGPGSFAGVRVGIAFGRAIAMASACPSVGITALQALLHDTPPGTVAARDIRRGAWLWQVSGDDTHRQGPKQALFHHLLGAQGGVLTGCDAGHWGEAVSARWQQGAIWPSLQSLEEAGLAATPQPKGAMPLYHRPPDAKPAAAMPRALRS